MSLIDTLPGGSTLLHCKSEADVTGNYFVSTYPPFSCWQTISGKAPLDFRNWPVAEDVPLGLYVHIPFCSVRCLYCYYLSFANKPEEVIDGYLGTVISEAALYRQLLGENARAVSFAYFGGGTPSLLSAEQLQQLMHGLRSCFELAELAEVTFECAPTSVSPEKLAVLKQAGVTRISIGVQQLNNSVLKLNGRVHLVEDVLKAYDQIQSCGFETVNLDLIVGLTGETNDSFQASLDDVIELQPDSITIYQLEIPQNTPLYRLYHGGQIGESPVSWETKRKRLADGFNRLAEAGYKQRSAYTAYKGDKQRSFLYQDAQYHGADLIGLGASAFSYYAGVHYQNLTSLDAYQRHVTGGSLPVERSLTLTREEQLVRELILNLKLGRAERRYFLDKFEVDILKRFSEPIAELQARKLLACRPDALVVTDTGLLCIDHLLPLFYLPEHRNVRYS